MSSAVTGKGVPVKVPNRSIRLSVLRLVRMAVAFVVVAGSLGLATVTATAQSGGSSCPSGADNYSDVVAGTTHADDIACLLELGIPAEGDTYRPGDDITRSEMARFMAGAYEAVTGSAADVADHAFTDVAGDPNEDDIARIAGLGITNGVNPEGTLYAPDDVVIRGHMALFLTRLYTAVAGSDAPAGTTEFTDIGERSAEQQAAIGQIFALGVTTGTTDTTYSPSNNVTREQMASFVARMYRVLDALPDPTEAPGAPTGVEVAVSGDDGDALDVSWTAPEESGTSDVTGYVVQWKSGDDDYSADNQSSVDGTSSTADGLTQGTAYTFRVAAVSDDGQSDWSDEASGNPGTAPGAVVDFTVDAGAVSGTLVLTWAAPADDGGTPITGYVVQWATGRDAASSAEISDGSATSYTITGLKTGVSYRVHIQAVNAAGAGAITAPADTDQSVVAPTTSVGSGSVSVVLPGPTDPEGSRLGGRFAAVTWLTPTLGRGQSFIETGAFHIQRKCGKEEWPATHTGDRASSQDPADPAVAVQSLDGEALLGGTSNPGTLTNGDECTYRVRANTYIERAGGTADTQDTNEPTLVGAWVQGSATPLGAPGTPGNATVEVANNSLRVTWTPPMVAPAPATGPEVNDGGSSITGYKITWASPATAPIGNTTVSATSTSHTITGLTNGLLYTVTIQAVNARGASTAAATDPANATPAAVAGAPTNVRVSQPPAPAQGQPDSRGNVLIVSWSAPAGNGTGNVTGYVVERRTSATAVPPAPPGDWGVLVAINSVGGPHTGTGTMATDAVAVADRGTSYDYRVRAENASGVGPWSTPGSGTAAALPSEVVNSRIEVIPGNRSLIVTWTPAAGNGNDVTHYNVRYARNVSGTEAWSSKRVNASALPTTVIGGLTSGAPYIIGITAVNAVGSSDEALTGGSDSPGFALAAPSSVTAMPASMDNTTGGNIVVTWSGVTNAVGYQVQWLAATGDSPGNPDGGWTAVTPSATALKAIAGDNYFDAGKARKVTIGDLTKGTTYVVRVRAVTQGQVGGQPAGPAQFGSPGFSAPVKAEGTPATAPADIDVAQPEKTTTLRVTWAPPADARVEGVTGYVVTWYPTLSTVTGNRGDANVGADARSYDITGLTAIGQGFTVVVSAVNEIGAGAPATDTATLTPATT